jgi:hypothetical protein
VPRKYTAAEAIVARQRKTNNQRMQRLRLRINSDRPNQCNSIWTDERHAQLVALFEDPRNLTTAEIGRRMGLTKNTIIGRIYRCHMSRYSGPTMLKRLQMLNDKFDAIIWETRKGTYQKIGRGTNDAL